MKQIAQLLLFFLLFDPTAWGQSTYQQSDFKKIEWLLGGWKGLNNGVFFYEAWHKANDSTIVNFSIEIKNGDTLIKESGALFIRNNRIFHGHKPVLWNASRIMTNQIVLKNDTLKYSNSIIWLHTNEGHWFTILENPRSTVYYNLTREPKLDKKIEEWIAFHLKKKGDQ